MVTTTTVYSFQKPAVAGDEDQWGTFLNNNIDKYESILTGNTTITSLVITTADINGGTLDNVVIGGSTAAAITGTIITANTSLNIAGDGATVTGIKDEDDMSSNSATKLATQQSIKAYVDAQVATADALSEVLGNGNTTGGADILFGDNDKAIFGAGSDLEIYHSGTASHIKETGTGNLKLEGSNIEINNGGGTKTYILASDGGAVQLRFDDSTKLATTSTGVDITGALTSDGLTVKNPNVSGEQVIFKIENAANTGTIGQITYNQTDDTMAISNESTGALRFDTTAVERLRIDSSGNVGIGTSSVTPYQSGNTTLEIDGGANKAELRLTNDTTGASANNANGAMFHQSGNSTFLWNLENDILSFGTNNTEAMRLTSTGLGIGTSSPATALDVSGTVTADGLTVSNSSLQVKLEETDGTYNPRLVTYFDSSGTHLQHTWSNAASNLIFEIGGSEGSGTERMRIDGSGNVGIGAVPVGYASVLSALQLGGNANIAAESTTGASQFLHISQNAHFDTDSSWEYISTDEATSYYQNSGTHVWRHAASGTAGNDITWTESMRIDGSGRVGIGQSIPSSMLHVKPSSDTNSQITIEHPSGGNSYGGFVRSLSGTNQGLAFGGYFNGTSTEVMRIKGDGTVNFVSPTSSVIDLNFTASDLTTYAKIEGGKSGSGIGDLRFYTYSGGIAERMRIDSSGNLLVGTTDTSLFNNTSGGGFHAQSNGFTEVAYESANAADPAFLVNNTGADGDIIQFRKDGTTVGSIGSAGGDLVIGTTDTGIHFHDGVDSIIPWNVSTVNYRDAAIDLGTSSYRFKDLYLSGGVYLGGTGSANHLDDYEKGTFTPQIADAASGGNSTTTGSTIDGHYVKVGDLVYVSVRIIFPNTSGLTSGNVLYIRNLPFTCFSVNGAHPLSIGTARNIDYSYDMITAQINSNATYFNLESNRSDASEEEITCGQFSGDGTASSPVLYVAGTYRTT